MIFKKSIAQVCYFVPDVREAAERHSRLFGSGPFFMVDHIPHIVMRGGKDVPFEHRAAVGQWGDIQLELAQQDSSGPSIFHDVFPEGSGRYGLHHVGIFVDDLESAVDELGRAGYPEITRMTPIGIPITAVFIDTLAICGHLTEFFEPGTLLKDMHIMVADAARNWDGRDPIRSLSL